MHIARAPLRISLGGGGTDVPSYYREHGGFVVAVAINRFVVAVGRGVMQPNECVHLADVPPGTGLGYSGSLHVARLLATTDDEWTPYALAQAAAQEEQKQAGGVHDAWIAAHGGAHTFVFRTDGTVGVEPIRLPDWLEERLLMFYTGLTRSADAVYRARNDSVAMLHDTKSIGYESVRALLAADAETFGACLRAHWQLKRSPATTSPLIDHWHDVALRNGALGGKVVGAGGGGFFAFLADDPARLRQAMTAEGLTELPYRIWPHGAQRL